MVGQVECEDVINSLGNLKLVWPCCIEYILALAKRVHAFIKDG